MIIEVEHCTTYNYSEVVKQSIQFVRLSPRKSANQSVIEWQLSLPGDVFDVVDGFGNKVSVVTCTGVMMKNGDRYAVAVRKPDHQIEVKVSAAGFLSGGGVFP